jgi:AraC-like DNA-binding protein
MRVYLAPMGGDSSFRLTRGVPDRRLAGLVRRYADFEERTAAPVRLREVASDEIVIVIDLAQGWTVQQGEEAAVWHQSFVGGLHDGPTLVEHGGEARTIQVNLTPLGARAVLGLPLGELAHRVVGLEDVVGRAAERLADRLHGARDADARFALLDRALLERVADAEPLRPDVVRAWTRLDETAGAIGVGALADELGCSPRHLSTHFRAELGLTPKRFARVLRFSRATERLSRGERLAEIAAACGYADQAHFNRDFRAFAGTTPTEVMRRARPEGSGIAA